MTPEDEEYRLMDKMMDASLAYWNALLGINGIFITVFSAITIFGKIDFWLAFLIILTSIVSSWFLIRNFKGTKNFYFTLGTMTALPTTEERKELNKKVVSNYETIKRNEYLVEGLLFVQIVLIFLILWVAHKQ